MTPEPPETPEPEAHRLRAAFSEAAHSITPGPVPLAAVEHRGRTRRRRRSAALAVGTALAMTAIPLALVQALNTPATVATPPAPTGSPAPYTPSPSPTQPPRPTAVQPGQRVDTGDDVEFWLTEEGLHWRQKDLGFDGGYEQFQRVTFSGMSPSTPDVTHRIQSAFHFGVYSGTKAPRVELRFPDGRTVPAETIELPGKPGWGAWYVRTDPAAGGGDLVADLYEGSGKAVATATAPPRTHH